MGDLILPPPKRKCVSVVRYFMKYLITTTLLAIATLQILAQETDTSRILKFPKIFWSIEIPQTYTIIDSSETAEINKRGQKAIEESFNAKINTKRVVTLFTAKKGASYIIATIEPVRVKNYSEYKNKNRQVYEVLLKTMQDQIPTAKFDTTISQVKIDGHSFEKFKMTVAVTKIQKYDVIMLSRLENGYDFGITYLCGITETCSEVEEIINRSFFYKPK